MSENPSDGLRIEQFGAEARRQLASVILSAVKREKRLQGEDARHQGPAVGHLRPGLQEKAHAADAKTNERNKDMNREKLSTAPFSLPKKAGMKREPSPYDPYKRKARGKENNPGSLGTGLFACERPRACAGIRKRLIQAAVEDALRIFCGTRRGKYCDRNLWAKFAWRFGWGLLRELTLQGEAEMRERRKPVKDEDKPKILQRLINPFWRRGIGRTKSGASGAGNGRAGE